MKHKVIPINPDKLNKILIKIGRKKQNSKKEIKGGFIKWIMDQLFLGDLLKSEVIIRLVVFADYPGRIKFG